MRRSFPAICAVALLLGGCGGGEDDSSSAPSGTTETTSTAAQSSQQSPTQDKGTEGGGSSSKAQSKPRPKGSSPHSSQDAALVRVPPISSAPVAGSTKPAPGVKTVKGGDNSVQAYGVESSSDARTEAAIALQGYFNARSQGDWGRVCSYLAQIPKEQLEQFIKSPKGQAEGFSDCAGAMKALGDGNSHSQPGEQATITEVLSFRGEGDLPGDPFYLIFEGPPRSTLYSMPMYFELGEWKVGLAIPSELPV